MGKFGDKYSTERKREDKGVGKDEEEAQRKVCPPKTYLQDTYAKFHELVQGNLSVEEYTRVFEELSMKCDLNEPDNQTIVRYLNGLDSKIRDVVELTQYSTFRDVCVLEHKVETQRKAKSKEKVHTPTRPPMM